MSTKVFMIVRRVLMPASSAASGLPPIGVHVAPEAPPGRDEGHHERSTPMRDAGPGMAIPVGMIRPPGGTGMLFCCAYCSARPFGQK